MIGSLYPLETYNYLNGTDYDDPDMVEVLHLDGGFTLTVRNDAAFIIGNVVNLYEHQTKPNPNMPLRMLLYTANLYKYLVKSKDIHGSVLINLPEPRYVVFYNGRASQPERQIFKLSEAYEKSSGDVSLELECTFININPGYNDNLKEKCSALRGYCVYVEKVRKYSIKMEGLYQAIGKAIDECIEEGILVEFFKNNRELIISADPIDCTIERREMFAKEEGRMEEREKSREIIAKKDETIEAQTAEIEAQAAEIARLRALLENRSA